MPTTTYTWHPTVYGERLDVECSVEFTVSGRVRRATRLDPAEDIEIDDITVTVISTGEDVTDDIQLDPDAVRECCEEAAADDEVGRRDDAAEREAEARRDR